MLVGGLRGQCLTPDLSPPRATVLGPWAGGGHSGLGEVEEAQFWGKGHRGRPCPVGQVPEPGSGFAHGSLWLFPAPQKASEGQDHELDGRQKAEDVGDSHHVNARHLLYPHSHVTRFPVPNEKVPWEVSEPWQETPGVLGSSSAPSPPTQPGTGCPRPLQPLGRAGRRRLSPVGAGG